MQFSASLILFILVLLKDNIAIENKIWLIGYNL